MLDCDRMVLHPSTAILALPRVGFGAVADFDCFLMECTSFCDVAKNLVAIRLGCDRRDDDGAVDRVRSRWRWFAR